MILSLMLQILFGIPPFPPWAEAQELPYLSCIWSMASPPLPLIELKKRGTPNSIIFFFYLINPLLEACSSVHCSGRNFLGNGPSTFSLQRATKKIYLISVFCIFLSQKPLWRNRSPKIVKITVSLGSIVDNAMNDHKKDKLHICVTKDAKSFISIIHFT